MEKKNQKIVRNRKMMGKEINDFWLNFFLCLLQQNANQCDKIFVYYQKKNKSEFKTEKLVLINF
jgi:hypothetical protein